jgi:hypothetical protein
MTNQIINRQSAVTFCAITDKGVTSYFCLLRSQYKAIKREGKVTIANLGKSDYRCSYKGNLLKRYEVTLWLMVNPSRDIDLDDRENNNPELKQTTHIVSATSEGEARRTAKEEELSNLCVWESSATEI